MEKNHQKWPKIEEKPNFFNFGWMVDLGMQIFEFVTLFLIIRHPEDPWVCIRSSLKQKSFQSPSVLLCCTN